MQQEASNWCDFALNQLLDKFSVVCDQLTSIFPSTSSMIQKNYSQNSTLDVSYFWFGFELFVQIILLVDNLRISHYVSLWETFFQTVAGFANAKVVEFFIPYP